MPMLHVLCFISVAYAQLPASDDIPRLWPAPATITHPSDAASLVLDPKHFKIVMGGSQPFTSDILAWNADYYTREVFRRGSRPDPCPGLCRPLSQLLIVLASAPTDEQLPHLGMDESYNLTLGSPTSTLQAAEVWGAVRGLETFSQFLQMNRGYVMQSSEGVVVRDKPKFPWRGLMIDPARHFMTVQQINQTIDAMAQNKLNALHIHLSDGESFTVDTSSWPEFSLLSVKGAFAPELSYSAEQLHSIVAHARLRGVRVIPEFDLPAHMASWAQAYEELITDCPTVNPHPEWPRYYSPADVTQPRLYQVLETILAQLSPVFPDQMWHVGGDEPHYDCWDANANVTKYKLEHGNLTNQDLYADFELKYAALVSKYNKTVVGWEEILFNSIGSTSRLPLRNSTVVQVWEGNSKLADAVGMGYSSFVSSNWYLNNGGDWTKYYHDDPLTYLEPNATHKQKALVLGGEACMWASAFDHTNTEPAIWPNAAAMAEQLWSPTIESDSLARTRLSQHRCRMVRRGVRAAPIAEDYCGDIYVRKSRSFYYPGDFPDPPDTPPP